MDFSTVNFLPFDNAIRNERLADKTIGGLLGGTGGYVCVRWMYAEANW